MLHFECPVLEALEGIPYVFAGRYLGTEWGGGGGRGCLGCCCLGMGISTGFEFLCMDIVFTGLVSMGLFPAIFCFVFSVKTDLEETSTWLSKK